MIHRTLALAALVFAGCASQMGATRLIDDVYAYNDGVRWNLFPKAAARLHPKERNAFVEEREELEEDLRISDYEIIHLDYKDKERNRAVAQVKFTWHLDSKGIVHTTGVSQTWQRFGKRWLITEEVRKNGDPMPGVAEPKGKKKVGEKGRGGERSVSLRHMMFEFR